jgi:hypothetical protein
MKIRGQTVYPLQERLNRLSVKNSDGCIEWTGSLRNGYGRLRAKGLTYQQIADRFGVHKSTIMDAIKGVSWRSLLKPPVTNKAGK